MAKRNSTRAACKCTGIRASRYVTSAPHYTNRKLGSFNKLPLPEKAIIQMKGRWLCDMGFTPGAKIKLWVMPDCIVMTKIDMTDGALAQEKLKESMLGCRKLLESMKTDR